MPVAFATTGSYPACPSRLDAFVLGVWVTAVFPARRIQQYNQYIRHSSSTFFSTNSPSRAHCEDFASVQATDTDPHRYLCWLLHVFCSPTSVHLDTRSFLSSCHQLNLSISAGFVFRVLVQLSLHYPSCSRVPLTPRRAFTGAHVR